ncbi:MAG: imidazolonepropionase [Deltaproteobacteria bacterium]|nr:imidazolonepropionase [Deltaproteobacteria bacterium]
MASVLFTEISELVTNRGVAKKGGVGVNEEDLGILRDGALLWDSRKGILWLGHDGDVPRGLARGARRVSLAGKTLSPALADCHTHLVFAGDRDDEFRRRLGGQTYQQIAAAGGGIASSVRATRKASESELYKLARARIDRCLSLGVGLLEIKSGYGLDWPNERKLLRVIARLKREYRSKVVIQATFLGAHAFPPEAKNGRDKIAYANSILRKMLPQIKKEKLADACDVFCDDGYFTRAQARRILRRAATLGLEIKLHADELADFGGAALAAELGASSADHLLMASDAGLQRMARRGVVATLLPATAFYLGLPYAPVAEMRRAGLCMALATDFNPGSSPTLHLPFAMSIACLQMGMTPAEVFAAATYGSARAMGLHSTHGSLRVGGKPKIAVFDCPGYVALISRMAHPSLCEKVF